jgi:uncharacterized membrane protein (UPF0127 family)
MKKIFLSAALLGATLTFYNCKDQSSSEEKSLTKEITFTKEGELQIVKASNDSIIASLDIEIADDAYQTETGLMYRNSLGKDQGMLFVFKDVQRRSFYMKNTKIPLDIIYLNGDKEVVNIQKNAKPFDETSLPSEAASQYVLEVNAGLTDAWNLKNGDRIRFSTSK